MLFHFTQPYFLALLLVLVPIIYWHLRTLSKQEPRLRFSTVSIARSLPHSRRQSLRPVLDILRTVILILLVVSLARPSISRASEITQGVGIDIVMVVDISYSMSARDLGDRKTRLETAQDVIRQFVANRTGDRIGLVVFAGESVSVSPLTTDYPILLGLLDDVDHGRLPDGTAIGNGLATAVNLLRDGTGKSRVAILLTDGQNNAGDVSPMTAARMAESLKIKTYTIGVGGATRGRFSPSIDEETLRDISDVTDGAYFRATNTDALKDIYRQIDLLEKTETGQQKYVDVMDLSTYFLLLVAVILIAETMLRNTWFRRAP